MDVRERVIILTPLGDSIKFEYREVNNQGKHTFLKVPLLMQHSMMSLGTLWEG